MTENPSDRARPAAGADPVRVADPALVLDRVSMTFKVPTARRESAAKLPPLKRIVYGAIRRNPMATVHALRELSLVVREGESLGLIGRNGSGKSTLSNIISGKLVPTTGEVWASGQPMLMGVNAALVPAISGRQNIVLGCLAMGMTREDIDARLPEIEEAAGLGSSIHLPIETYSSGMSARLRFAIATSRSPEVLVIDEALNVGDAQFRERSQRRLAQLREEAGCVVLVSHNAKTVTDTCQRVLWLDHGSVVTEGDPEETMSLYTRYNGLLGRQDLSGAARMLESIQAEHHRPALSLDAPSPA